MKAPQVYFIQPVNGGPIKIGCSEMLENRVATLMAWSPYPLRIIARIPGDRTVEKWFHWRFRRHRTHSEWFRPAPEILLAVDTINETGTFPEVDRVAGVDWRPHRLRSNLRTIRNDRFRMSEGEFAAALEISAPQLRSAETGVLPWSTALRVLDLAANRGIALSSSELLKNETRPLREIVGPPWRPLRRLRGDALACIEREIQARLSERTWPGFIKDTEPLFEFVRTAVALAEARLAPIKSRAVRQAMGATPTKHGKAIGVLMKWEIIEYYDPSGRRSLRFAERFEQAEAKAA